MRHHKKTYEEVFSIDHKGVRPKLYMEKISIEGMELEEYIILFKDHLSDFYSTLFYDCVRFSWLRRKFCYYGRPTILPMNKNSRMHNSVFVKFVRRILGKDPQIITRSKFFPKLEEYYFETFFPGFVEGNPFTNPDYYEFPFENISIDYLMAVYHLDDRFDLLKKADKDKMSYAIFVDYVINHVLSENESLGRDRYIIRQGMDKHFPFCVKDSDKEVKTKYGLKNYGKEA